MLINAYISLSNSKSSPGNRNHQLKSILKLFQASLVKFTIFITGPLITKIKERSTLIGVTSFGEQYCNPHKLAPGVFGRVTHQLRWILNNSAALSCQGK